MANTKGFAVPRLRRKADGQNTTDYVDVETGEVVNPKDYKILDQYTAHLMELGLITPEEIKKEAKKTDEKVSEGKKSADDGGDYYYGVARGQTPETQKREMANDFGYINKPGFMSLTGVLPGPLGLVGKAANVGINLNNKVAVDSARASLGLPKSGGFISGAIKDNQGYIGDVSYNGVTSPVGFEASDKLGRTTLTPNEARMRQQLSKNFREAEPVEKTQSIAQFQKENPEKVPSKFRELAGTVAKGAITGALGGNIMGGVLGSLMNSVKSYGIGVAADAIGKALHKEEPKSVAGTPGHRGLGDLSPSFGQGINYTHEDRGPVEKGLSQRTKDVLSSLAASSGTGITVTSAYRSPSVNKSVGGASKSLHMSGDAFDVSTSGLTNQQKRDLVERAVMSGAMEIGTYPDQSLHIASVQRMSPTMNVNGETVAQPTGGVTAMHSRSRHNYLDAPGWFRDGLEVSRLAPTPTPRPEDDTPLGLRNEAVANVDLSRLNQFSPAVRTRMAQTLAGEIDPRYTNLSTDIGRQEAFGILSTMENRANTFGSVENAINAPNQYSTWNNNQAAQTAISNYNRDPETFNSLVDTYVSDPSLNRGFTNYYNPSVANPGWGATMVRTEDIGPHRFGALSEYSTFGKNFGQTQMSEVTKQVTSKVPSMSTLGTMASAEGTVGFKSPSTSSNLSGFSSSVSGENANRSNSNSSSYDKSKDSGLGGSSATRGFSSSSNKSSGSSSMSSSSKIGFSGSASATAGGNTKTTTTKSSSSTYDRSKDSGLGGTSSTKSSSPHNKGDSNTSSGRLGGRV